MMYQKATFKRLGISYGIKCTCGVWLFSRQVLSQHVLNQFYVNCIVVNNLSLEALIRLADLLFRFIMFSKSIFPGK